MSEMASLAIEAYRRGLVDEDGLVRLLEELTVRDIEEVAERLGADLTGSTSKTEKIAVARDRAPLWRREQDEPTTLPPVKSAGGPESGRSDDARRGGTGSDASDRDGPRSNADSLSVLLGKPRHPVRGDLLSHVIRARSEAVSFERYVVAIDAVVCREDTSSAYCCRDGFRGTGVYDAIMKATLKFLRCECDLPSLVEASQEHSPLPDNVADDIYVPTGPDHQTSVNGILPYWHGVIAALLGTDGEGGIRGALFPEAECAGALAAVARGDCAIELIWSYWYEEAMLVQAMQAIAYRFQNRRGGGRDPLAGLEIDPLRPLNNIIWGYVQNERDQLSVARRAYEYDHHYGLRLRGRAVGSFNPIDSRTRFLEAFHQLLYLCTVFYKEEDDNTVTADGFPILTALQELHVILAEGAHNQYGDLPTQARAEMLVMQWILARPEIREFLPGRASVPYRESWMGRLEAMRTLQGWKGANVNHFSVLAEFGERLLLSVRLRNWLNINDPAAAGNWAAFWREEIQSYVHSYRAATGVDLGAEPKFAEQLALRRKQPSELLARGGG